MKVLISVNDVLCVNFMDRLTEKYSMDYLTERRKLLKNHAYARYTTYCRYLEAKRPSRINFAEAKEYFNEKHRAYRFEDDGFILPAVLCTFPSTE